MTTPGAADTRSKTPIIAVAVVLLLAIGVGGWYFFLRDDSPAAFDIDTAAGGAGEVQDDDGSTDGSTAEDPADDGSVEGTWTVDPAAGADAGGTSAGFRVDEELASIGATTAVGRTTGVDGSLSIEGSSVTAVDITVDMASLETDDSRRDGKMRSALATDEFPTATFSLTEPIDLGDVPEDGETISVTATGDLTIKGVTNTAEVSLDAQLVDGTLVVVGSSPVVFADYGVETPTAAIVVSLEDEGTIEFQLFFQKG